MQAQDVTAYKDYIRRSLDEWKSLEDEDIQMDKFFSLGNIVYKATTTKDVQPKTVIFKKLVRTIGPIPKEDIGFLSLKEENLVCDEMSNRGYGPKLLVNNEHYRIESCIEAQKIDYTDLSKIENRRAHVFAIANFNKMKVEGFTKKKKLYHSDFTSPKYFEDFENLIVSPQYTPEQLEIVNTFKNITSPENIEFIRKIIPKDDEELVLGHSDQHFSNILLNKENGKVTLIDYEMAALSFKGDDIGCFNLYTILNAFDPQPPHVKVYEENYPTDELYRELAEYYAVFLGMDDTTMKTRGEKMIFDKNLLDEYVKEKYSKEDFEAEVKKIVRNVKVGMLGLAVWLLKQSVSYPPSAYSLLLASTVYQIFLKLKEKFEKEYL